MVVFNPYLFVCRPTSAVRPHWIVGFTQLAQCHTKTISIFHLCLGSHLESFSRQDALMKLLSHKNRRGQPTVYFYWGHLRYSAEERYCQDYQALCGLQNILSKLFSELSPKLYHYFINCQCLSLKSFLPTPTKFLNNKKPTWTFSLWACKKLKCDSILYSPCSPLLSCWRATRFGRNAPIGLVKCPIDFVSHEYLVVFILVFVWFEIVCFLVLSVSDTDNYNTEL